MSSTIIRPHRAFPVVGLLLPFILLIGACSEKEVSSLNELEVEDLTYQLLPSGARIVSGVVYNPTQTSMGNIQIQISLFDGDNVRVDGLNVVVRDVDAGSRVPFREPVDSEFDVTGARVRSMIKL